MRKSTANKLGIAFVAAVVALSVFSDFNKGHPVFAQTTDKVVEQKAEPTQHNVLSAKCRDEILQHRASAECEEEGKQWSRALDQKLHDPKWRQEMIDLAGKNHWDVGNQWGDDGKL